MPTDVQRIQAVFLAAAEIADPANRARFLDGACDGDNELRSRVEALLRAHDQADSLLDHPAVAPPDPGHGATQALTGTPDPGVAVGQTTGGDNGASDEEPLTFLAPPTRSDALGRLGHYEVLQVLGRGGFGIVFRAFDEMLQRVVALKVMVPQLAATSPARKRFLREARSSAQVRHENVVQVYEVAEQPLPYLAMEFIPGETLQQRLDRVGPLDVPEVLRIGRQIAEGLAAAHATDLIHRDIKPGNVLLEGGQQKVKITDFGLARTADDASISQSGIIAGTPMYMAPEQALGQTLDQRADLFSLGSVLYQMVSGRPPFRANSAVAVLKRVAEDQPRAIREIIPEAPQWLCDIIAKLHAKNPDERFQSARVVADVLADCEAQLKANARLKDYSRIPRSKPAARQSDRWKWVAAAVLLLPVIALTLTETAGVTRLFRGRESTPDPTKTALSPLPNGNLATNDKKGATPDADSFDQLTFEQIKGLLAGKAPRNIDGSPGPTNEIPAGTVLVYRTNEGRYGKCQVIKHGMELELKSLTYDRTGKVFSKGDKLVVRPSWYFDLDDGKECGLYQQAAADFWWAIASPEKRSIVPQDGAVLHILLLPPTFTNSIGMDFGIVPKGKSWLGGYSNKWGDNEIDLPADFYLGKYEVTQEEWAKVMGVNPSWFSGTGGGADAVKDISDADLKRFPVENVSWDQIQIFVAKLNRQEKDTGWVYRLPTQVEWEYACRGGPMSDKSESNFDCYLAKPTNALLPEQANFQHNKGLNRTCKVGSYEPNRLGLFDMHGNVAELCDDSDRDKVRYTSGGSYRLDFVHCRACNRYSCGRTEGLPHIGLRLARVPVGAASPAANTPASTVAPFTDADVRRIAALPAEQQVEEVRKELMRRNPGFDGKLEHKIEDGAVTEFKIVTDKVTDIAPIRVFSALRVLDCSGTHTDKFNGLLADLTPLKGMNLAGLRHLDLTNTKVTDAALVYFKNCKDLRHLDLTWTRVSDAGLATFKDCKNLTALNLGHTQVGDAGLANFKDCKALMELWLYGTNVSDAGLAHFKDCKDLTRLNLAARKVTDVGLAHFKNCKNLTGLDVAYTQVGDAGLAHLKGMPLMSLWIYNSGITDLTPLEGMPLEDIRLTPKYITRGLEILRGMKTLKTIGIGWDQSWPAAEFWERYDKGEFKE